MSSNVTRDKQRLMQLDAKILDLRYLEERERMREATLGKTTLLMSRVFKNRIVTLERARNQLAKQIANNPNQRATYQMELSNRKQELDDAREELDRLEKEIAALAPTAIGNSNNAVAEEMQRLAHEIPIQKRRIASKLRVYENWAAKEDKVPLRKVYNKLSKSHDAEEDAIKILNPTQLTAEDILGNNPNWKKPENNATIDLISNPATSQSENDKDNSEAIVEENPFKLNEPHSKIEI